MGAEFTLHASPEADGQAGPRMAEALEHVRARITAEGMRVSAPEGTVGAPWPVCPVVTVLDPRAEPVLRARVSTVVRCLERVVCRYAHDTELQSLLGLPSEPHWWMLRHPAPERLGVDFCRLDLLGDTLGTVRVLEFNASSPGGVLSLGMMARFWRESALGHLLEEAGATTAAPVEADRWFADWLTSHGRRHGIAHDEGRRVGLLYSPPSRKFEFNLMEGQLRRHGLLPVVQPLAQGVETLGKVRLGYLKYVPSADDPRAYREIFHSRFRDADLVVPNVPVARFVAENKLCLAVLSDPRFRRLFTEYERAALDALVPYSRKLGDGITETEAVARRTGLVLKAPYGCRGEQVTIGAHTSPGSWEAAVRAPQHRGWLLQQRVIAGTLSAGPNSCYRDLVVPVLDGRVVGYGSRTSTDPVVNGARGGAAASVFAPHPL
ncbi:hypothetical protein [Streptomyces sp. NPDC020667]|uniref:hypothetical protein n=1 Tax=Streptomyces sp. NPDC020667 TaxID=3154895 RepID=UPI0034085FCB